MAITGKKPSEWSTATITAVKEVLSLNSANYITVDVGVDAKANGAALIAAYTAAKALTPNGAALATDNRACVIIPPANYDLDHGEDDACVPLTLDTEFVDIIGLTTDRELQHIYGTPEATNSGVIVQTANDVHISNLTVEILTEVAWDEVYPLNYDNTDSAAYSPSTNLNNTVIDNCAFVGMDVDWDNPPATTPICSMRWGILEYSGTFTNCTGCDGAFGGYGTASGTFKDCTGGEYAFGGNGGTASGTFKDCTGGISAFGGGYGTASGTFKDCTGGISAFGGDGIASGTFTNCTGDYVAFGGYGTASGTFTNCTGGDVAFGGYGTASGAFKDCTGGDVAFGGGGGIASGTFTNCTGGDVAFGGNGTASGTFSFCKLTDAFGTLKCTVATVEIASGGTLYEIDDELTVVGGTGDAATLKVTSVTDGVIDGIQVLTVGNYTALPSNPVATTGHTEDATFNLKWNKGHIYGCVDSTVFIAERNWNDR